MSNDDKIRTGLWKKESTNGGAPYYGGKVEIEGQEYWVNLYKNDRKTEEKHPDLTLQLKPVEASRSAPKQQTRQAPPPHDDFQDDDLPF